MRSQRLSVCENDQTHRSQGCVLSQPREVRNVPTLSSLDNLECSQSKGGPSLRTAAARTLAHCAHVGRQTRVHGADGASFGRRVDDVVRS